MTEARIYKIEEIPQFHCGDGVLTTPLICRDSARRACFTSGLTQFPPERTAPMHSHNRAEQVRLLEDAGEVEVDGTATRLRDDTTWIRAGKPDRFDKIGATPVTILCVYGAEHVTRTLTETGKTVDHLSAATPCTRPERSGEATRWRPF